MTEELRLSVSKTKTFLDCKKKFNYNYIQKLPKKDWEHHIFGKFCHTVLEEFHIAYLEGSELPYNTVMSNSFKKGLLEYKGKMTPTMKKDCWDIIDKYLRIISNDKNNRIKNVIAVEKKFDFPVVENLILNGAIDRIQMDADNVIHVCDYKTVKNKKYLKNDFFQLLTYAYVLLADDPTITKVRGSYILLRHDFEYITTEFSLEEILKVKDKYVEYASQIRTEQQFPANPTALCNYCDFQEHCVEGKSKSYSNNMYGEVAW